jgi:hypothetical protein
MRSSRWSLSNNASTTGATVLKQFAPMGKDGPPVGCCAVHHSRRAVSLLIIATTVAAMRRNYVTVAQYFAGVSPFWTVKRLRLSIGLSMPIVV